MEGLSKLGKIHLLSASAHEEVERYKQKQSKQGRGRKVGKKRSRKAQRKH